jgi:hypothetical protein
MSSVDMRAFQCAMQAIQYLNSLQTRYTSGEQEALSYSFYQT